MKRIVHVFDVAAQPRRVFQALTTGQGLAGWWSTHAEAQAGVGGTARFRFVPEFNPQMQILAWEQDRSVTWKCTGGHAPWLDNRFTFRLEESEPGGRGGTVVTFEQEYARELDDTAYGRYNYNWGYYLESLRLYCETGQGKPFAYPAPSG